MNVSKIVSLSVMGAALSLTMASADTLSNIKSKGILKCGVSTGIPGLSTADSSGNWKGLDVDMCRSTAAAVLGDDTKVKYVPLTGKERFIALSSGEVDLLVRGSTWTETRDTSLGVVFAGVNYYDGQGFLVSKDLGIKNAAGLDGATFCIQAGTTTEQNLTDYFRSNNMDYKAVTYDTSGQVSDGFKKGRCDAITTDASQLAGLRTKMDKPSNYVILPDIISKEPLGPVVKKGDDKWFSIVKWTMNATLQAEESGLTKENVDSHLKSKDPTIQRLLGLSGKLGENLGLDNKWAYRIIKQVGNYGQSYDLHFGEKSPLKIPRGQNNLWNNGGLMYPMPFR